MDSVLSTTFAKGEYIAILHRRIISLFCKNNIALGNAEHIAYRMK